MTWLQNAAGRPVEILHPVAAEVDWAVMAHSLAHLNRYTGHARVPVSVGLHLLVGLDLAPAEIRPWWLLHDAHEERVGDASTPLKEAMRDAAIELGGEQWGYVVERVRAELEARHDGVIHFAAGLALPNPAQVATLKALDLTVLATERRDFLAASTRRWHPAVEAARPGPRVQKWRPAVKVADALHAAFRTYLPALQTRAA